MKRIANILNNILSITMLKNFTIIVSFMFLFLNSSLLCQKYTSIYNESKDTPNNSLEVAFAGTSPLFSLNLSYFAPAAGNNFHSYSFGALFIPGNGSFYSIPLGYSYNLGNGTNFLEMGAGITVLGSMDDDFLGLFENNAFYIMPTGTVGWRLHISDWGVFRLNMNLLLIDYRPVPLPGVSLGFRF